MEDVNFKTLVRQIGSTVRRELAHTWIHRADSEMFRLMEKIGYEAPESYHKAGSFNPTTYLVIYWKALQDVMKDDKLRGYDKSEECEGAILRACAHLSEACDAMLEKDDHLGMVSHYVSLAHQILVPGLYFDSCKELDGLDEQVVAWAAEHKKKSVIAEERSTQAWDLIQALPKKDEVPQTSPNN